MAVGVPSISVVIPTLDRPKELAELLQTISGQSLKPLEVIIIDQSQTTSAKQITQSFINRGLGPFGCNTRYINETKKIGLTAARNHGVKVSNGDAVLFLDDDTVLDQDVIKTLALFLNNHPSALGAGFRLSEKRQGTHLNRGAKNALWKVFMLNCFEPNRQIVRKSGRSIFASPLTEIISVQRQVGCCCYRKGIFNELSFDENLKRWSLLEDLDFSYRAYKKHPHSLYLIPDCTIQHNVSKEARPKTESYVRMQIVHWFYLFFKEVLQTSISNLPAFLWALIGNALAGITEDMLYSLESKSNRGCWRLTYIMRSYVIALVHLPEILRQDLGFLNPQ